MAHLPALGQADAGTPDTLGMASGGELLRGGGYIATFGGSKSRAIL